MSRSFTIALCSLGKRRWSIRRDLDYLVKFKVDLIYLQNAPTDLRVIKKWARSRGYTWVEDVLLQNASKPITEEQAEHINTTRPSIRHTIPLPSSYNTAYLSTWML